MPTSTLPLAVRVIRAEHDALAAMLRTVPLLLDAQRRAGTAPDFGALRAMLFYVDEFPERLHHTKESTLLFPKLRARAPELRAVLDDLDADHAQGERAIRELQHSLLAWEQMGEPRREKFAQQIQVYTTRYLRHMRREETEILPRALATPSDTDRSSDCPCHCSLCSTSSRSWAASVGPCSMRSTGARAAKVPPARRP